MNDLQRDQLKANLRAAIAGKYSGIDLETPFYWVVENVKQPAQFFANLHILLPEDATLYFEGCSIAPEAATFYEANRAPDPKVVARDRVFPDPDIYHVAFSPAVTSRLQDLALLRPAKELCDHIKAYRRDTLLFKFHDAFDGWLAISEHVTESAVAEFCRRMEVTYRRKQTKKRDVESLRVLLHALEHPEQVGILREPWWKRACRVAREEFIKGWREG